MKPPPPLRVTVMPNRTANYRGYAIEGEMNDQGWSVEVHPRGPDFPILSQSAFRVAHPSWNSALAEATSRVDAVLDGQLDPEPKLPTALEEVFGSGSSCPSRTASTREVASARAEFQETCATRNALWLRIGKSGPRGCTSTDQP